MGVETKEREERRDGQEWTKLALTYTHIQGKENVLARKVSNRDKGCLLQKKKTLHGARSKQAKKKREDSGRDTVLLEYHSGNKAVGWYYQGVCCEKRGQVNRCLQVLEVHGFYGCEGHSLFRGSVRYLL